MSQISPPMRILLVGSIVFLAAWFAFLRPGGESDVSTAPAPGNVATGAAAESAPGQAAQAAQGAVDATNAATAASGAARGETTAPATSGATTESPAGSAGGAVAPEGGKKAGDPKLPGTVAEALAADKVVVMLFWNRRAADDREVRRELARVDQHGGKVKVHVADIEKIARYAAVTQGVDVQQSPSIVVVDREQRGVLLEGFVDRPTIDQAVSDALRGSEAGVASKPVNAYFKSVNRLCTQASADAKQLPVPSGPAGLSAYVAQGAALSASYDKKFAAMKTPAKHRGFAKRFAAYNAKSTTMLRAAAAEVKGVNGAAGLQAFQARFQAQQTALQAEGRRQFGKYGLSACFA